MPIHLVLRARKSILRLPRTMGTVDRLVNQAAAKYGIKIYEFANVGNHLHLVIQIKRIKNWPAFIRELTSRIAFACRPAEGKFWLYRPFTRIVRSWKKAFQMARDYVELNRLEADGHIRRSDFKSLAALRLLFSG